MARDLSPQCKRCRRIGEKLFLKGERCFSVKCAMTKRNYPPGVHGSQKQLRPTDYGTHLREKQKLSRIYGLVERQVNKYFKEAVKSKKETDLKLIEFLERRLDNVIYRLGLATSRAQARQMVGHGLFLVNQKKVTIPSYRVKAADVINIRNEKSFNKGILAENLKKIEKKEQPSWLNWSPQENLAKVLSLPQGKDLAVGIDTRLIVEFYSK